MLKKKIGPNIIVRPLHDVLSQKPYLFCPEHVIEILGLLMRKTNFMLLGRHKCYFMCLFMS